MLQHCCSFPADLRSITSYLQLVVGYLVALTEYTTYGRLKVEERFVLKYFNLFRDTAGRIKSTLIVAVIF